ncbi:UNVERIFIED_CONTAM: F-box protein SKIP14 [Sesamum angustifolium]|uniref:F-box protein SKIP14 n=1 Tax=Sesamum angustifolium TaxID=2727405 RepID=A0AAW2Q929_9LAMI
MALNYSHRPVFPAHTSEENLVSPVRIVNGYLVEDVAEKNGEAYSRPWHMSRGEAEDRNFSCGRERVDRCSSSESTSKDIVDLLPSDPFGMDIKTTFTAITGWLEDLEVDCGGYMRPNNFRASQEGYGLFAGWNLIWNNSLKFQPFPSTSQLNEKMNVGMQSVPSNLQVYEKSNVCDNYFPISVQSDQKLNVSSTANTYMEETGVGGALTPYDIGFQPSCNMGEIVGFRNESDSCDSELQSGKKVEGAANFEGVPHEALAFALSYLGVKDLLSVERVCKSLLSTVRGDPLLWMTIHIDQPLNERITDDVLVQLASRAQGTLQCLSLVECPKITDDGLRHILETNPRLSKLCVPGCTRISIECIVNSMRAYNCNKDVGGIKHLRIGGLYGVNHEHFEELKLLLGADQKKLGSHHKPHFYHRGNFYLPYDDDRAIDIEMCPRCEKFRLVYDCPAEGCRGKDKSPQVCRGCTLCIARCAQCGRCINDTEFEETFCLELLCSDCFKQLQKYQDKLDKKLDQYGAQHGPSYHFGLHG